MLIESQADILVLQEVNPRFFRTLVAQPLLSHYYESKFSSTKAPGGLYILSIFPIVDVAYFERTEPGQLETKDRARMLVATLSVSSHKLAVATTVLDSSSARRRAKALDFMFPVLQNFPNVIFTGDFKFDQESQPETEHLAVDYADVWKDIGRGDGDTWNPSLNPKARLSDPSSDPSRIDRVFLKSHRWMPSSIELFGDVRSQEYPTSHFALKAEFSSRDLESDSCTLSPLPLS